MSNTFKSIQFWNTQSGFKYPETDPNSPFCYQPIMNRPNSGICVSGGGSVSASLIAGYYAALQQLGIMNNLRYISGVSGGTWGSAPFVYKPAADTNFSGTVALPAAITTNGISTTTPGSMQDAATKADIVTQCLKYLGQATLDLTPADRVYEKAVGSLFLNSFGINSPAGDDKQSSAQFFTSTSAVAQNIQGRNTLNNSFMTMATDMPFLIMNATMFVPANGSNYIYPFEITPLYCGIKAPQTAGDNKQSIGGFFVESFGFNTTLTGVTGGAAQATGTFPFELCQPVGASGSALEDYLVRYKTALTNCFPKFSYWNPLQPDQKTQQYNFGDGGCIEDTGITPLLARGVQNIAAFLTEPVFFPSSEVPASTDTVAMQSFTERAFGYNQIASLFGMPTIDSGSCDAKTNTLAWKDAVPAKQVFDNSNGQFIALLGNLFNARKGGGPMVVKTPLTVIPCNLYGIATGYQPQVIWSVIDQSSVWSGSLSQDAQNYMKANASQFTDFPVVDVFGQDPMTVIKLTAGQTNLLADFAYWLVMSNSGTYTGVLNIASVPAEAEVEFA